MNWVDFVLIGIVSVSLSISLVRGFVREAFSLAAWILAVWVSWSFFRELAVHLEPWVSVPSLRLGLAFAVLLLVTLILGAMVNFLISQLVERTGLTGTDRLLGMFFGVARGVLLIAILVLLAGLTPIPNDPWWQESRLIPYFQELAVWLRGFLPVDVAKMFNYT
jgi:membrane protein required for colicin V production